MSELKTKKTTKSVEAFIASLPEQQQKDSRDLLELFTKVCKQEPILWGNNVIGFGEYHYRYASGREGDWFVCGFSPRKNNISIHLSNTDLSTMQNLLTTLGKHKIGKSCLYVNKLEDINLQVLSSILQHVINNF